MLMDGGACRCGVLLRYFTAATTTAAGTTAAGATAAGTTAAAVAE